MLVGGAGCADDDEIEVTRFDPDIGAEEVFAIARREMRRPGTKGKGHGKGKYSKSAAGKQLCLRCDRFGQSKADSHAKT